MGDGGRWDKPGIPHRGWWTITVFDLHPGDEAAGPIDYATCEMCDHHPVRFVHVLGHEDHAPVEVGRVCAGRMTEDDAGPRDREQVLRNRASRRSRWLARRWRKSAAGNLYLKHEGVDLGVFASPYHPGRWGTRIGGRFGRETYDDPDAAKLALFDEYENSRAQTTTRTPTTPESRP